MKTTNVIPESWMAKVRDLVSGELNTHPPVIGVIGLSGVGKSSTLNVLFKTDLPVSDTVACTKELLRSELRVAFKKGKRSQEPVKLIVIDAPGLGEDIDLDPAYLDMYQQHLSQCDVIIWVMAARNRAMALDQYYLRQLLDYREKIVFAINQAELIEPQAWNERINTPLPQQEAQIAAISLDKKEKIEKILGIPVHICSYSAKRRYNLEELFQMVIRQCPPRRKWIFEGLKNFHYSDFLPEDIKAELNILNHSYDGINTRRIEHDPGDIRS